MNELEDVEEALNTPETSGDQKGNAILLLAVIAAVNTFLANQDEILKTAFEDAALVGHTLTPVWPYVLVLIAAILWRSGRHE